MLVPVKICSNCGVAFGMHTVECLNNKRHQETRALEAIRTLIEYIGDDPNRSGLRDTPKRVLQAWKQDWGTGYQELDVDDLVTTFDNDDNYDEMVFLPNISFYSFCEHHISPFFGSAYIAYIPNHKIIGISKLARIVRHFSSRLQIQEGLTIQITDFLVKHLSPDCALTLEATHLCMASRGVREPHATTITTSLRGVFKTDDAAHSEFESKVLAAKKK